MSTKAQRAREGTKNMQQRNKGQATPRGVIRLPVWWQRLAHRLDWAGWLAERWAPTFHVGWLALTAVVFPLLLILLAFLFTPAR
ncbi:MAG: hypothetical protein DWI57_00950 [Chloroflexi bacterium]|nr:MAG: hypothetical protein DWI57_00950 [Chloroflexota bacterium]